MYIDVLPIRERKVTDYLIVQTEGEATARVLFDYAKLGIVTSDQLEAVKQSIQQMKDELQGSIGEVAGAVYVPKGSCAFNDLPTLQSAKTGWVYNVTDDFTTDENFVEGAGKSYPGGTNVVCAEYDLGVKRWDILGSLADLTAYVKKDELTDITDRLEQVESKGDLNDTTAQQAQAAADAAKQAADDCSTKIESLTTNVTNIENRLNDDFLEKD